MTPFGDNIHYFLQRKVTKELPRRVCGLDELLATARNLHADAQRHRADGSRKSPIRGDWRRANLAVSVLLRSLYLWKRLLESVEQTADERRTVIAVRTIRDLPLEETILGKGCVPLILDQDHVERNQPHHFICA